MDMTEPRPSTPATKSVLGLLPQARSRQFCGEETPEDELVKEVAARALTWMRQEPELTSAVASWR
jgi:hypothetical protein